MYTIAISITYQQELGADHVGTQANIEIPSVYLLTKNLACYIFTEFCSEMYIQEPYDAFTHLLWNLERYLLYPQFPRN